MLTVNRAGMGSEWRGALALNESRCEGGAGDCEGPPEGCLTSFLLTTAFANASDWDVRASLLARSHTL